MRIFWPLVLLLGVAGVASSCSSKDGENDNSISTGGGTGGGGGSARGATGGATAATGGGEIRDSGVAAAPGRTDAACTSVAYEAEGTPINLIFVYDKSDSMGDYDGGDNLQTRWIPARDGLLAFLADPGSSGLRASLTFFPVDGGIDAVCNIANYEQPDVPLQALTADNEAFATALEETTPGGGTPTRPALIGGVNFARTIWEQTRDQISVVVLVTDGQPGMSVDGVFQPGCDENHMGGVADVARAAANGSPPISTYVIGITDDPISLAGLDVVADAGGTGEAVIIDDVDSEQTRAEFQATLERIRQNNLACYLRIPEPPPGSGDLEFDRVNVDFVSGGGDTVPLDYDPNCASGSGWQYDGDNRDDPSWIQLCPTACGQVRSDSGARMDIQLGCETRSLG